VITDCTIANNTAAEYGGGIWLYFSDASILNSTISDNKAGAVPEFPYFGGGGIFANGGGGHLTLTNCRVERNSADLGGGVGLMEGTLTIQQTTISENFADLGGGICVNAYMFLSSGAATLTIVDSTIAGNVASSGGAIYCRDQTILGIVNSTIYGNFAQHDSGGLFLNDTAATLRHATIVDNFAADFGGGISADNSTFSVDHTIVASNATDDIADLFGGNTINARYSLIGSNLHSGLAAAPVGSPNANGNMIGTSANPIDPLLGALSDNGGPTKTLPLLAGSPAIDKGDIAAAPGVGTVPANDQRGAPFGRVFDGRIDIGAAERQPIPAAVFGDYNGNGVVDASDYVVWRRTLNATGVPAFTGADGDGDGAVDQDDYGVWRAHFGQTVPAAGAGSGTEAPVGSAEEATAAAPSLTSEVTVADAFNVDLARQFPTRREIAGTMLPMSAVSVFVDSYQMSTRARLLPRNDLEADLLVREDALATWHASRSIRRDDKPIDFSGTGADESASQVAIDDFFDELDVVVNTHVFPGW
jgi:parallel beta-helix repeat protein/predicted outer membrane repeat protein